MKGTFTMAVQNPPSLFLYELCSMYDAEQQLVKTLPILAQECNNQEARDAFMQHEQETRQHVRNLEQCFQILGSQPSTLQNHTISGLKQDHDIFTQQQPPQEALTMFDLNAGYQSEYIEIATYNSLIDAATSMGMQECVDLFRQNLQQEEAAARKLGSIIHQMGQQTSQMNQGQAYMPNQGAMLNQAPMSDQYYAGNNPQMQGQSYTSGNQQPVNQDAMNQGYPVDIQPGQSETFIAGNPQGANQSYAGTGSQSPTSGSTYAGANPQASSTAAPSSSTNASMNPRSQLQQGMEVVGQDTGNVGTVKEMRDGDFLIDRPMKRDVYVPYNAIQNIDGGRAILNIPAGQVDSMGWDKPPLL
jgi:ferritin-like metal-binding protein YciE